MAPPAAIQDPVLGEIARMWEFAREQGFDDELKALHRPRPWVSVTAAWWDWALIGLAVAACVQIGWWATPLAILLIGNRQRALGNLLHDASHYSFHPDKSLSRWLANLLLCWPLWISMPLYRKEHNAHHKHLADPDLDPDFIHDDTPAGTRWPQILLRQVLSRTMFRNALLGHAGRLDIRTTMGVIAWWCCVLALTGALLSPVYAATFFILWIVARATSFHVITAIREISDHVGLVPGTLIGFSRNHPFDSLAAPLIHPHNNGYHLLHHLAPRLPYHAFPRAHEILLSWPRYAEGEQCDSYLLGKCAAAKSWQGLSGTG